LEVERIEHGRTDHLFKIEKTLHFTRENQSKNRIEKVSA
jgi:hypothetical protein